VTKVYGRRERTARLLNLQILLWQYPNGLTIEELANKCSISARTIYRDMKTLESELGVPLWEDGNKRGISEGYFLPPINFTLPEAIVIFIAARLMQGFSPWYNPNIASTFAKLATIVPIPLRESIQKVMEYIERQPRDKRKIKNFHTISQAWLSRNRVKILYKSPNSKPIERIIEPYSIETAALGRPSYLIARCPMDEKVEFFELDKIIGDVTIDPDNYVIPPDFNDFPYNNLIKGIYTDNETETVKLRFDPQISEIIRGTIWHPSQQIAFRNDGSMIMTLKVHNTYYLHCWILGFLNQVEVIEPEKLRNQIREISQSLAEIYTSTSK
jgi:predicted DNA-binding transcriptional regulator YafY